MIGETILVLNEGKGASDLRCIDTKYEESLNDPQLLDPDLSIQQVLPMNNFRPLDHFMAQRNSLSTRSCIMRMSISTTIPTFPDMSARMYRKSVL